MSAEEIYAAYYQTLPLSQLQSIAKERGLSASKNGIIDRLTEHDKDPSDSKASKGKKKASSRSKTPSGAKNSDAASSKASKSKKASSRSKTPSGGEEAASAFQPVIINPFESASMLVKTVVIAVLALGVSLGICQFSQGKLDFGLRG